MRGIIDTTESDTQDLLNILWDSIKDMDNLPIGSERYGKVIYHPTQELYVAKIVEDGFGWDNIKAKLIELGRLDDIETLGEDWSENE